MKAIDLGIDDKGSEDNASVLARLLADTYFLYLKTQNFHWNVTGPNFYSTHLLLEKQYDELAEAIDTIAERIRALGFPAPGSFAEFTELASIREETEIPTAVEMVEQLLSDHQTVARIVRQELQQIEQTGDEATVDMLIERLDHHEKTAWMLRSILSK